MNNENLKRIEQAAAAVESARRRYDGAKERTRTRPDVLQSFIDGGPDDLDAPQELAAATRELCLALRLEIQTRRAAGPKFEQSDASDAACHAAAVQAVDKEIEATKADKKEALRKLGFTGLVDAPRPVSVLGSLAPARPTLGEQFLAGNSEIVALEARRKALLLSPPTPQAGGNALEIERLEKCLRELLNPTPKVMRHGFPLSLVCTPAERESYKTWLVVEGGFDVPANA